MKLLTLALIITLTGCQMNLIMPYKPLNKVDTNQVYVPPANTTVKFIHVTGKPCVKSEYACIAPHDKRGVRVIWMRKNMEPKLRDEAAIHECRHAAYGGAHIGDYPTPPRVIPTASVQALKDRIMSECLERYVDSIHQAATLKCDSLSSKRVCGAVNTRL